jgi:putative ABC transport system permease protein
MNGLWFALRSLLRQRARTALGVLGVAAVGALLFDMLLLSQGLLVSMRDLLDRTGWDVRVTAGDELPRRGRRIDDALDATRTIASLPSVRAALAVRWVDARLDGQRAPNGQARSAAGMNSRTFAAMFVGESRGATPPWTVLRGRDATQADEIVIDQALASAMNASLGDQLTLRASCTSGVEAPPPAQFRVAGIGEFPFEAAGEHTVGGTFDAVAVACGERAITDADLILVLSTGDPAATAAAIRTVRADLRAATNEEVIGRLERTGFTYFRQISTVLTVITLSFALLLITVLLTVSVNQRLGEIAALRALGFSRRRVVVLVLSESALIVGIGGVLSLPLGLLLASGLDTILREMPGIPDELHFFVFEARALAIHLALLSVTAIVAALYPMHIVSRLPIAATLRNEVVG